MYNRGDRERLIKALRCQENGRTVYSTEPERPSGREASRIKYEGRASADIRPTWMRSCSPGGANHD